MTMYKVIRDFYDMNDNFYSYSVGDTFPRKGKKASAERLEYLTSNNTRLGAPVIQKVVEKVKKET